MDRIKHDAGELLTTLVIKHPELFNDDRGYVKVFPNSCVAIVDTLQELGFNKKYRELRLYLLKQAREARE